MLGLRLKSKSPPKVKPWHFPAGRDGVVFVMGSGRSGTHWLGAILDSHLDIRATVEAEGIFGAVTRMALVPEERYGLLPYLVERYRQERGRTRERWYADKSHPSLWIAEYLADAIPSARFIGIVRDPYQTIASMIRHRGVNRWPDVWRDYPIPNRFLGIDEDEAQRYEQRSTPEKHALRWISHARRLKELQPILRGRMYCVRYEDLQQETLRSLQDLQGFLGLDQPFPPPDIRRGSMTKWREVLTQPDIDAIEAITGVSASE